MLPDKMWGQYHHWGIEGECVFVETDALLEHYQPMDVFIMVSTPEEQTFFEGYKLISGIDYQVFLRDEVMPINLYELDEYVVCYTYDPRSTHLCL